ncbi:MAG: D-glycero-beta-D-manno-heptose 1,7-bisphosphate 7-phosphatase [Desulfobacteraceae bacterium]|nr:D-glycero-beta-D-manno-heptose 1,7-bisphosphate 7-phosphatase [Desulfobacteraceae bacterium]
MKKTIFLDRDGVINEDSPDYIKSWREFHFIPGSIEGCRDLVHAGFDIIVITNQSAVGRGMITRRTLEDIHRKMQLEIIAGGGEIRDIFFCPHHPDEGCTCRKPLPGLVRTAAEKYGIDLSAATMVGDSTKDIDCGRRAGCGHSILVRTGNGDAAQKELAEKNRLPDHTADDLCHAAQWITTHFR